jgi:putative flippase GtrA
VKLRNEPKRAPLTTRFIRYAASSVLAVAASALAFAACYRVAGLGPQASSLVAFATGALVNFLVNRFWAWRRRYRTGLVRDAWAYTAVAVGAALAATAATTVADSVTRRTGLDDNSRAMVVEGAYFATYAAMFLLKFVLLDRWVFRSRSQVDTTTRP